MARTPAIYLRRSHKSSDDPGEMSEAAQLAACEALTGPGYTLYMDWGVSGGSTTKRKDFRRLMAAIERGEHDLVVAYSMSRFSRHAGDSIMFAALCKEHETDMKTVTDKVDTTSPQGRLIYTVMSGVAQWEREAAAERTAAAQEQRKVRGDVLGRPPYGYRHARSPEGKLIREPVPELLDPVIEAYQRHKTFRAAAMDLTAQQFPTPDARWFMDHGKPVPEDVSTVWAVQVVQRVIGNARPDLLPPPKKRKYQRHSKGLWGQLWYCHCGSAMTVNLRRNQLRCWRASLDHTHPGRGYVSLSKLRPFMEQQAAKYQPAGVVARRETNERERSALQAQRTRITDAYTIAGAMSATEYRSRLAAVDAELADLDAQTRTLVSITVSPVGVDFTKSDDEVGDLLRTIWTGVHLDMDMKPVRVEWRVPAFMHDADARARYERELAEAS